MDLFKNSKNKDRKKKYVGRGGKRGTTSGKGTKGQRSRSGHRIRMAKRDLLIRLPKLRGYKNKSLNKAMAVINLENLNKMTETVFSSKNLGNVKILGGGDIAKAITIENLPVSKSAREKIEKAGGKILISKEGNK